MAGTRTHPDDDGEVKPPPLLRGYLRIGAWICGAPAYNPGFQDAGFFTVLDMDRLGERYRRFFLRDR